MAISVVSGEVPYYGIFSNKAVLLNGINSYLRTDNADDFKWYHSFTYIFPWDITKGTTSYYACFEGEKLCLYAKNPDTKYSIRSYSESDLEKLEKAYTAIQPYYEFDMFSKTPYLEGAPLNARCYIYEHDEFVFFHFDFYGGHGVVEIVVTKDGYIQYNSLGDIRASGYHYFGEKVYFSTLTKGCDSCAHKDICPTYSSSNTTCTEFGDTYCVYNWGSYLSSVSNYSNFLFTPLEVEGGGFELSLQSHLDLSGKLVESVGELSIMLNNELHHIPLSNSTITSKPNLSVCVGNTTKYIAFSADNSSDKFSEYTPLRLYVGGSIKSPYMPRTPSSMKHTLYDLSPDIPDFNFYTYKSGSSYRYFGGVWLYTLSERIRVKQIRLFGSLITPDVSMSECKLPNSTYPKTLMMINTGTSDLTTDWLPSNTDQTITFEFGYLGSAGKQGQYVTVIKDIDKYIKQFAFTPSYSGKSSAYSGAWLKFNPLMVELVEYSTGNTYYYNL